MSDDELYYLHSWDTVVEEFVDEEMCRKHHWHGVYFPKSVAPSHNGMADEYPGGYKYWKRRPWSEAPDWVRNLAELLRQGKPLPAPPLPPNPELLMQALEVFADRDLYYVKFGHTCLEQEGAELAARALRGDETLFEELSQLRSLREVI